MALTPEQIDAEAFARWGEMKGAPLAMCRGFARSVEAEVHAQDTALIQQMLDAALTIYPHLNGLAVASDEALALLQQQITAITAARARLKEIARENNHS